MDKIPISKLDYLHIFNIETLPNSTVVIEHIQEVPPRTTYYYMVDINLVEDITKLYLVYENNYRVLMYPDEY